MPLDVQGLEKSFASFHARADFHVGSEEILVLAGPSGCGKTTVLQLIAGLLSPDGGAVRVDGVDVTQVPAWRRGIGVVFQDLGLFPHLDVGGNVAYGPAVAGFGRRERERIAEKYLAAVHLDGYRKRRVETLSGGERQRVAIARALAAGPRALLMDEPFSSLDAPLRRELRGEFRALRSREGFPCLFVTHDRDEAAALADRIAVMREGRIVEIGSPRDLFLSPRSAFVADFLGAGRIVPLRANEPLGAEASRISSALGSWTAEGVPATAALLVPPDALALAAPSRAASPAPGRAAAMPSVEPTAKATVREVLFEGDRVSICAELTDGSVVTLHHSPRFHAPRPGEPVTLEVDRERISAVVDDLAGC